MIYNLEIPLEEMQRQAFLKGKMEGHVAPDPAQAMLSA
ncbi:hypothetical protein MCACP_04760 [Neomoorella carbonis]